MKKIFLILSSVILLWTCSDYEPPVKILTIGNRDYNIKTAIIQDFGTDIDISHRIYGLSFRNSSSDPDTYLTFEIYSYSTTELADGDYDYSLSEAPGLLSYVEVGKDVEYDEYGYAIAGSRYAEANSAFSGSIYVNKKGTKYHFVFDLETNYKGELIPITGEYEGYLTEGTIY